MPVYPTITEPPQPGHTQSQIKLCSSCHGALSVEPVDGVYFDPDDATILCSSCRDQQVASTRLGYVAGRGLFNQEELVRRPPRNAQVQNPALSNHVGGRIQHERPMEDDMDMDVEPSSLEMPAPLNPSPIIPYLRSTPPAVLPTKQPLRIDCNTPTRINVSSYTRPRQAPYNEYRQSLYATSSPDPLVDITRIRVRSQSHHCLYPGATFQGTQKSGRNSYDVNVTIVDVDFSSSFLCGYLRIRGLTDDWPELTTYFDAEIIGSRYGFLTQNWGATEEEDMVHWQRFPAFRYVKHELKKPHLTIPDRDRGAVFMRWKEKFLVPDHRVQDINGASFAGFYYVCVDFNPQPHPQVTRSVSGSLPAPSEMDECGMTYSSPSKTEIPQGVRIRRDSSVRRGARAPSVGPRSSIPVPTMSGFYFHQNSEPYQQLSLSHVPERTSSSFEFR